MSREGNERRSEMNTELIISIDARLARIEASQDAFFINLERIEKKMDALLRFEEATENYKARNVCMEPYERRAWKIIQDALGEAARKAEKESSPGARQLPKLADHGRWDDGFGELFATETLARLSNTRKTRMETARKHDELLYAEMKKELEKPPFVEAEPLKFKMDKGAAEVLGMKPFKHELAADAARKAAHKKRNADLVHDAIELHDKLGTILDPLSGKSQKFRDAYGAFGLALLNLLREVR